jgi:DNA-binding response OmpR family regulator
MAGYLPALVVDANGAAAQQLAAQLRHSGFQTDVATSCPAAHTAARATHYGSLVVVADPNRAADLDYLATLRKKAPRAWLIAISSTAHPQAKPVLFRCGIDQAYLVPALARPSHKRRPVRDRSDSRPHQDALG